MKTPLQQLLDYTTDLLHTFDSEERVAMAVLDYLKSNKKAMLEKEKEVMSQVYADVGDWDEVQKPRFENYYNKTFNTFKAVIGSTCVGRWTNYFVNILNTMRTFQKMLVES